MVDLLSDRLAQAFRYVVVDADSEKSLNSFLAVTTESIRQIARRSVCDSLDRENTDWLEKLLITYPAGYTTNPEANHPGLKTASNEEERKTILQTIHAVGQNHSGYTIRTSLMNHNGSDFTISLDLDIGTNDEYRPSQVFNENDSRRIIEGVFRAADEDVHRYSVQYSSEDPRARELVFAAFPKMRSTIVSLGFPVFQSY